MTVSLAAGRRCVKGTAHPDYGGHFHRPNNRPKNELRGGKGTDGRLGVV